MIPTPCGACSLSVPHSSHRHFSSLARRLGRIFAHAYFHHREAFEQAEAESSLYARFLALTSKFDLVPAEFLVIPPRLTAMGDDGRPDHVEPPRLLGAALDPRRNLSSGPGDNHPWNPSEEQARDGLAAGEVVTRTSPAPPIQRRNPSPRKFGRNRTDTMVYSEAFSVAEELAKGELSEVDIDREIAAERTAAAAEADVPTPAVLVPPRSTTPPPPPEEAEHDERAKGEEAEHEEEVNEGPGLEHVEVPEPEVKSDEAEEPTSHEEVTLVEQPMTGPSGPPMATGESQTLPEGTPARADEAAEEKEEADVVESALLEVHEERASQTEEPASAPSSASDAHAKEKESTGLEVHKDEEEDEEGEDEEEEEEGSGEEEESSDDDSDVSSTVLGVVQDEPVVAAAAGKKEEAKPDVPEEAEAVEATHFSTGDGKAEES